MRCPRVRCPRGLQEGQLDLKKWGVKFHHPTVVRFLFSCLPAMVMMVVLILSFCSLPPGCFQVKAAYRHCREEYERYWLMSLLLLSLTESVWLATQLTHPLVAVSRYKAPTTPKLYWGMTLPIVLDYGANAILGNGAPKGQRGHVKESPVALSLWINYHGYSF